MTNLPPSDVRRLAPGTIILALAATVGRFLYLIVLFVFLRFIGGRGDTMEFFFAALGLFAVFAAVLHYISFRYWIEGDKLRVQSGILHRQDRTVPLERIQNINLKRSWLHRLLHLTDVEVETASGTGAEVTFSAVTLEEADRLKHALTTLGRAGAPEFVLETEPQSPQDTPPVVAPVRERELFKLGMTETVMLGASENRAGVIVAAGFSVIFFLTQSSTEFIRTAVTTVRTTSANGTNWQWVALALVGLLLLGWFYSVASALLTYSNFTLSDVDGRIRRKYGLINQVESVVRLQRLQMLRIRQTVIQRMLRLCQITVSTAGSFQDKEAAGSAVVAPLLPLSEAPAFSRIFLPLSRLDTQPWAPISSKAFQRRLRILAIPVAAALVAVFRFLPPEHRWESCVVIAGVVLATYLSCRNTFWFRNDDMIGLRSGVLGRMFVIVPHDKVQVVSIQQSPGQRQLRLCHLTVQTAAGDVTIPDLDLESVIDMAPRLRRTAARAARAAWDGL